MSKRNRGNHQEFEELRDLLDRSSAHFRAFSTDNSNDLLANEILSTTHLLLDCADAFVHRF